MSDPNLPTVDRARATWWAESRAQARAATAAVIVLIAVLLGISAYVWASPAVDSSTTAPREARALRAP